MSASNPAPHPSRSHTDHDTEFSLLDLVNVMLVHRRLMVVLPICVAAIVATILLVLPRNFTTSVSFMPQTSKSAASQFAGLAAQLGMTLPGTEPGQSPDFYASLLNSRTILGSAVDTTYAFEATGRRYEGSLADLLEVKAKTAGQRRFATMKKLKSRISVKTEPEIGLIRLSVRMPWPELSRQVAERMLAAVSDFNLRRRQSQAAAERRFVQGRLTEAKGELRSAERSLQAFLERNRDYRNSPLLVFEQNRLQQDVSMRQTVYTSLAQSYETARIDEVRNTPVITIVESPDTPVRPDPRDLVFKTLLALVVGGFLALAIAFSREVMLKTRQQDPERADRVAALKREALEGLWRPWSGLRRKLSRQ